MSVVYQFTVRLAKRNGNELSAVHIIENLADAGWSLFSDENKIIYTDAGDKDDYDYIAEKIGKDAYYEIVCQKQRRGEPIAFAMFYAEAGRCYRMDFIITSDFYVIASPGDCTRKMLPNATGILDVNWYFPKIIPYLTDDRMIVEGYSFEKY